MMYYVGVCSKDNRKILRCLFGGLFLIVFSWSSVIAQDGLWLLQQVQAMVGEEVTASVSLEIVSKEVKEVSMTKTSLDREKDINEIVEIVPTLSTYPSRPQVSAPIYYRKVYDHVLNQYVEKAFPVLSATPAPVVPMGDEIATKDGLLFPDLAKVTNVSKEKGYFCSLGTRRTLTDLTKLKTDMGLPIDANTIAQGDAITLIQQGIAGGGLEALPFEENTISDRLFSLHSEQGGSLFDMYRYASEQKGYRRGHRFASFLGCDGQWYVLDNFDDQNVAGARLLSDYVDLHGDRGYDLYVLPYAYQIANDLRGTLSSYELPLFTPIG